MKILLTKEISRQLRTMREESGLPAWYVAEKIGVSAPSYSRYENAAVATIEKEMLDKIGKVFGRKVVTDADDIKELRERIIALESENGLLRRLLEEKWAADRHMEPQRKTTRSGSKKKDGAHSNEGVQRRKAAGDN